jgi:hypothetical protein
MFLSGKQYNFTKKDHYNEFGTYWKTTKKLKFLGQVKEEMY